MQEELVNLKRKLICQNLYDEAWDYTSNSIEQQFFKECFGEVMGWFARRGNRLSQAILPSVIERFGLKKNLNPLVIGQVQAAIKSFTKSYIYEKIEEPIINFESLLGVGKGVHLHYLIPSFTKTDETVYVLMAEQHLKTEEDLARSIEAKYISVWSFYHANRYPNIYNILYKEDGEVETIRFKPKQNYIRKAKAFFLRSYGVLNTKALPAPAEVCQSCARRSECKMAA